MASDETSHVGCQKIINFLSVIVAMLSDDWVKASFTQFAPSSLTCGTEMNWSSTAKGKLKHEVDRVWVASSEFTELSEAIT